MATNASQSDDSGSRFIDVKVFSQLPHPHATIHFHSLLDSTSVRELKVRVQQIIPAQVPIENLRFIHQGRVLARDSDTLVDIFGWDAVLQAHTHTLHLVVREQQSSNNVPPPAHDAAAPSPIQVPNPALAQAQAATSRIVHNGPFPVQGNVQFAQPGVAHLQHLHNHGPFAHAHVPGTLQQTPFAGHQPHPHATSTHPLQQTGAAPQTRQGMASMPDFNAIMQQQVQQAMAAAQPTLGADNILLPRFGDVQDQDQGQFRQGDSHHTQSRATQRADTPSLQSDANAESPEETQGMESASGTGAQPLRPAVQQESVTRQGIGPNGERWSITTNTSSNHFHSQPGLPPNLHPRLAPSAPGLPQGFFVQHNNIHMAPFGAQSPAHIAIAGAGSNRGPSVQIQAYPGWLGPAHAIDYVQILQSQLESTLQNCRIRYPAEGDRGRPYAIDSGLTLMRSYIVQRNRAQQAINHVLAHGPPTGHTIPTSQQIATLQSLNDRFQAVVRDWSSDAVRSDTSQNREIRDSDSSNEAPSISGHSEPSTLPTAPINSGVSSASLATGSGNSEPRAVSNTVTAYLLRSPQGSQAIIYSHEGVFSSSAQLHPLRGSQSRHLTRSSGAANHANATGRNQHLQAPNAGANQDGQPLVLANRVQGNPLNEPFIQQLQQQLRQQPQQPANGIAVNLTPFFQALWLFIRGYAFMWLFLGGRGTGGSIFSWRSIVLLVLSFAYWAVQAGVGAQQIAVVRRYWNDLVGPRPEVPQERQAPVGGQQQQANDAARAEMQPAEQNVNQLQHQRGQGEHRRELEVPRGQGGSLRELMRPFERTVALFLASLYPGIGERHVAERDRARREAEERDRARAAAAAATAAAAVQDHAQEPHQSQREERPAAPSAQATHPSSSNNAPGQDLSSPASANIERAKSSTDSAEGNSSSVAVREDQEGLTERRRG